MIRRIPEDKGVLLLALSPGPVPFTEEETTLTNGKSTANFKGLVRLGGGHIGCDPESLNLWHKAFYSTVETYLSEGRFMGKDQDVMATTCLESDLCMLVPGGDPVDFFKLQPWL